MKKVLIGLLLLPIMAFAKVTSEEEFAINRLSGVAKKYSLGTLLDKNVNLVVGRYSFAVQGGNASATPSLLRDLTDAASTIVIPSGAIIKQVWTDTLATNTAGSLGFKLQSTFDLMALKAASGFTGIQAGVPVGVGANMIKLTADRTLKAEVGGTTLTGGRIDVYIEYSLGN